MAGTPAWQAAAAAPDYSRDRPSFRLLVALPQTSRRKWRTFGEGPLGGRKAIARGLERIWSTRGGSAGATSACWASSPCWWPRPRAFSPDPGPLRRSPGRLLRRSSAPGPIGPITFAALRSAGARIATGSAGAKRPGRPLPRRPPRRSPHRRRRRPRRRAAGSSLPRTPRFAADPGSPRCRRAATRSSPPACGRR